MAVTICDSPSRVRDRDIPPASRHRLATAVALLAIALFSIYAPSVGHGFVKDDFSWIARGEIQSADQLLGLFRCSPDFFRPLVALSFAINRYFCGLNAFCYGLTNLALLGACAVGIAALGRALSLPAGAAVAAAAIWTFNFHGVGMAVMWISGRTALLLTLFAVLAARAYLSGRLFEAGFLVLLALLSKEEAVVLPFILLAWSVARRAANGERFAGAALAGRAAAVLLPLCVYLAMRSVSGAFTFASAPSFYRPAFTVAAVLSNVFQYLDRSLTFAAIAILAMFVVCRPARIGIGRSDTVAIVAGLVWLIGGFAITIFLPVRSSLYVCFPSVGVALAGAALANAIWRETPDGRRARALLLGLAVPFLLWPFYYARNQRLQQEAELSERVIQQLRGEARLVPHGADILLRDDRASHPSLDDAFGTLIQEAVDLRIGRGPKVRIEPPATDETTERLSEPLLILRLENGRLIRDK